MTSGAPLHARSTLPRHAGQAGFTLVELMVAMTGGLFLSIVVFALSRDASHFYQRELRLANATVSGSTGFERLSSDIARAGHLVTPNIADDPRVCNRPDALWPALIRTLRAINIDTNAAQVAGTEVAQAGIAPMAIELAGALDVTEELTITQLGPDGTGGYEVFVRRDTPAASRMGIVDTNAAAPDNQAILQAAFIPQGNGRAVRIVQQDGKEQYGIVTAAVANPALMITLGGAPALMFRTSAAGSVQCGIQGFNTGGSINVVNFMRYELRPMTGDLRYQSMFDASKSPGLPYEANRVELIREELTPFGVVIDATREIISEYAVDLQFTLMQATSASNGALIAAAPGIVNNTFNSTQLLRGVHARLSVRSREADRLGPIAGGAGDIYRFPVANVGGTSSGTGPGFARAHTFQADIPLRNLQGANW